MIYDTVAIVGPKGSILVHHYNPTEPKSMRYNSHLLLQGKPLYQYEWYFSLLHWFTSFGRLGFGFASYTIVSYNRLTE
jgi:hypothetical protein